MQKIVALQSPAHLFEVVPAFYHELNKLNYFDAFYIATNKTAPPALGGNVHYVLLEQDLGWEGNLQRLLDEIPEEIFTMMCDDHVTVSQTAMNLNSYFETMQRTPALGRLQLSPPTLNYYRFLKARRLPLSIPDDSQPYYQYDKRYRWHINFQASIWRKDFLREIIQGGGNRSQMELRAAEHARRSATYHSGYIGQHAVRYENFLASCQLHHIDPSYHRRQKISVYREEFARYAKNTNYPLDPAKLVYIRRRGFSALVPAHYCLEHFGDTEAYRKFAVKQHPIRQALSRLERRLRAKIAPYISYSWR